MRKFHIDRIKKEAKNRLSQKEIVIYAQER